MSPGSVSFDRAAEYYDRTRFHPPRVERGITEALAAELGSRGRTLEIAVGTGRVALPLHAAGIALVGADISRPMMDRLILKAGGLQPFPLLQADATRLPFDDGSFGAAYGSHILHLIPSWNDALRELVRVVEPGGVVLLDQGTGSRGTWWDMIQDRFLAELEMKRRFVGVDDPVRIDEAMRELGASVRSLPRVRGWAPMAPEVAINALEANLFSWTWELPEADLHRAAAATRAWARPRFGPLERPRRRGWTVQFRAYDLPGRSRR